MFRFATITGAAAIVGLAFSAQAQVNLTAETASPGSTPGVSVLALSEVAAKDNIANIQVATGQTLTNSVQNVAEGKTDVAAAPFVLPFLMSRAVGPYAKLGKEKGAELASKLAVLYTYQSRFRVCMLMTAATSQAMTPSRVSVFSMAHHVVQP